MTRAILAVIALCATPAIAGAPTHQIIMLAPGTVVYSEPLTKERCEREAQELNGSVIGVPHPGGVRLVVVAVVCVPLGEES